MKKILNLIYSFLSRKVIMAQDKAVLERSWKNDHQPYGYRVIKRPYKGKTIFGNETYKMIVCKILLK